MVVYNAETLNAMLAQHWKRFAKQPYFDRHGIFFSAIVSTPMLLTMFFLLVRTPVYWWTIYCQKAKLVENKA